MASGGPTLITASFDSFALIYSIIPWGLEKKRI